ncbi:MAG: ABC transporter permease [Bacteroides sp.]|nr:ABC transporter permease [Bacteroides sp.]
MKELNAALWVEMLKVRRTKILLISIAFFTFIGIMMGMFMFLASHPEIANRSSTLSMKTSFIGGTDWKAFYDLLIQIILTVGVIGSGFITSWVFGREFSDRAIKDILALPVRRSTIVVSKLIILLVWSILLSLTVLVAAMLTGLITGIPGWSSPEFFSFLKLYLLCALLNSLLITPIALVASIGKGYMLPISFMILILILTQLMFVGLPALSIWFPWALPALFSGVAGEAVPSPGVVSYALYFLTVLAGIFGTMAWWRFADHK